MRNHRRELLDLYDMKWTAYVQQDGDDLVVPIPDELLQEIGWRPGDILQWNIQENGSIIISKKKNWYQRVINSLKLWKNRQ